MLKSLCGVVALSHEVHLRIKSKEVINHTSHSTKGLQCPESDKMHFIM